MIKIGVTGTIAAGKTVVAKILSKAKHPIFSADKAVKKLYSKKTFKNILIKKFNISRTPNIKKSIKELILLNIKNLKKLEKIIHPMVRKEMAKFTKKKSNKIQIYEIPLLVEKKLINHFDLLLFVDAPKKVRLQRYIKKKGKKNIFLLLEKQQMKRNKKASYCDHIIVNNSSLAVLRNKIFNIMENYE